jgi:hypothetical protein
MRSRVLLLLALLGVSQPVQAQSDRHTFPETGQTVSGAFWAYWQAHGGLAQQGYPISGEFIETSALDGKPYTVQYFERAVFEAHPENAPPYDVLLSQLGRQRYQNPAPQSGGRWQPAPGLSWQWQLSETLQGPLPGVAVYDSDLFGTAAAVVAAIHAQGGHAICYISAGSYEDWQSDRDQFPAAVLGKDYAGWPGERWLDIRRIDLLAPVMRARLDLCRAKGFDAVEPDNVDGYQADTGFPLTKQDQLAYNRWFAAEAHTRGLAVGLKNSPDLVTALLPDFDWALTEDCFAQGWCDQMAPFIQAGKAVFAAEYTDSGMTLEQFCPQARALRFSAILKHLRLDSWRAACPPP